MKPFPENYELESFFESEPLVLDQDIPWAYNNLSFDIKAKNGHLAVIIEPGYEVLNLTWSQGDNTVLVLKLKGVLSLQVSDEKRMDTLTAKFRSGDVDNLIIRVRPVISVTWGYNDQV